MVVEGEDCYENNLDVAFGPGLSAHTRTGIKRGAGIRFNLTRGCSFLSVGKTASGESGQNDGGLERDRGIGNFAEARGNERMQWGKRFQPVVLSGLQGKGLVRQRSLFADLIFCYFLIKQKVKAIRGD